MARKTRSETDRPDRGARLLALAVAFGAAGLGVAGAALLHARVEEGPTPPAEPMPVATARLEMKDGLTVRDSLVADRTLAERTLARRERLCAEGFETGQSYDQARFRLNSIGGRIASVDARLRRVALDLQKSVLVAPFAGTVSARIAD